MVLHTDGNGQVELVNTSGKVYPRDGVPADDFFSGLDPLMVKGGRGISAVLTLRMTTSGEMRIECVTWAGARGGGIVNISYFMREPFMEALHARGDIIERLKERVRDRSTDQPTPPSNAHTSL